MEDSLQVFESIVNSRWFAHSSIVLFMNKADIFLDKIQRAPLENYFLNYKGKYRHVCGHIIVRRLTPLYQVDLIQGAWKSSAVFIHNKYKQRNKAKLKLFTQ
jgi:hypothetical protein